MVKKTRRKVTLTPTQKLEVLQLAKKKLGPGGKNWTKHQWFAQRSPNAGTVRCAPSVATCFCLEGAVEIAAMELGYVEEAHRGGAVARETSILRYVKTKLHFKSVNFFNDRRDTEWKDVLSVINGRIRELKKEIA